MDDALQAAADVINETVVGAELVIGAWLEHPDVAGCDCDNGQRQSTLLFGNDVWNRPEWGPCDRCEVVTVGGIDSVRVREDTLVGELPDEGFDSVLVGVSVPAEGVDDDD